MKSPPVLQICGGVPVLNNGLLRHQISIEQYGIASPPVIGPAGPQTTWNSFATIMAHIAAVRGTDVIRAGQDISKLYLTVTSYWVPGILPKMRVVDPYGAIYVIETVEDVLKQNFAMVLNCEALGVNDK